MAIDITKGAHKAMFPSKVNSAMKQGGHVFNVTLINDHDNGDLVVRDTAWTSFDNYAETETEATFTGIVQGESTSNPDHWFVEVLTVADDVVAVYNSPVSPYAEKSLQDETLFYNEAGDVVQGMTLSRGDLLELSENAFSGTLAVGASVTYDAANNLYVIA